MGMRPSDKDIEREIREGEMYHKTAYRALAEEAVTRWNVPMERGLARHKQKVPHDRCGARSTTLLPRRVLSWMPAGEAG